MKKTATIKALELPTLKGGAWKVAYADFVTAMMAFFLLLWLLNVSTDEQKNAISNFFDPTHPKVSESQSGAGGVLGGLTVAPKGAMTSTVQPLSNPKPTGTAPSSTKDQAKNAKQKRKDKIKKILKEKEEQQFKKTQEAIKQAIAKDPNLENLAENLIIDITPEGLRIQIVDQEGRPMFASGSANMFDYTKDLMTKIAEVIGELPNELSIRGHTDSVPYSPDATYTNWELSTDRANSSRRVLKAAGVPEERLNNVVGKADTEHLLPEDPTNARNRRISIILLKEELTNPDYEKKVEEMAEDDSYFEDEEEEEFEAPAYPPIGTFRKTPGAVEFP